MRVNISSSSYYRSLQVSYLENSGTSGTSSAVRNTVSGKKPSDSAQFSPEAMEKFAHLQEDPGSLDPSKVDLNTDDKKRILAHLKERFASLADTSSSTDSSTLTDASGAVDAEQTAPESFTQLKEQLSAVDLDQATEEEISSLFTQVQSTLQPWNNPNAADEDSTDGARIRKGGRIPPMGERPPMGKPPAGSANEAANGTATTTETPEQLAQNLLDLLTEAYNEDKANSTMSKSDFASKLKEQLSEYQSDKDGMQLNDAVFEQLIGKLSEWASSPEVEQTE
jgi:hypothetical protein